MRPAAVSCKRKIVAEASKPFIASSPEINRTQSSQLKLTELTALPETDRTHRLRHQKAVGIVRVRGDAEERVVSLRDRVVLLPHSPGGALDLERQHAEVFAVDALRADILLQLIGRLRVRQKLLQRREVVLARLNTAPRQPLRAAGEDGVRHTRLILRELCNREQVD